VTTTTDADHEASGANSSLLVRGVNVDCRRAARVEGAGLAVRCAGVQG
jgi:hypothetical protein